MENQDDKPDPIEDAPESEPKPKPVKRPPPKPAYLVPNGVAFLDKSGNLARYRAGDTIEHGIVPMTVANDYIKRGDLVALTDN